MERPHTTLEPAAEAAQRPQIVHLARGGQAVINGALVTASEHCTLEVGSGAFVLTGRALWRNRGEVRNPREELYFSMIDAATSETRFEAAKFRLFSLLSQVVAQDRTHQGQKECSFCAAALLSGRAEEAVQSAARLAADNLAQRHGLPGQPMEKRARARSLGQAYSNRLVSEPRGEPGA